MYSPVGFIGGLQRVPVSGGLPEATAPRCYPQVSGPFPSRLTFRGPHCQPPSASERLRGQPNRPRSSAEEDHPGGALVGTGMLFTYPDPFVGEGGGVLVFLLHSVHHTGGTE